MSKTIREIYYPFFAFVVVSALMVGTPKNAHAGFEWAPSPPRTESPPVITPSPAHPGMLKTVPVETAPLPSEMQTLQIEKLESDPKQTMKTKTLYPSEPMPEMHTMPRVKTQRVPAVSVHEKPQPKGRVSINPFPQNMGSAEKTMPVVVATPAPQKQPQQAIAQTYPEIVGFGTDLPLALALRQVVPAQYSFSFADGVNPGYRVSWNGGRPWNEVLNDMVSPLNLSAQIHSKIVSIKKSGDNMSALAPQDHKPQAGEIRRSNITDPGETPGDQNFGGFKMEDPATSEKAAMKEETTMPESGSLKTWEAKQGDSLKTILSGWSKKAGAELIWNASHDYTLDSNVMTNGTFGSAVKILFASAVSSESGPTHKINNEAGAEEKATLTIQDKS